MFCHVGEMHQTREIGNRIGDEKRWDVETSLPHRSSSLSHLSKDSLSRESERARGGHATLPSGPLCRRGRERQDVRAHAL